MFLISFDFRYFGLQGSRDNMSAILIRFPNAPKLCQQAVEKVGWFLIKACLFLLD